MIFASEDHLIKQDRVCVWFYTGVILTVSLVKTRKWRKGRPDTPLGALSSAASLCCGCCSQTLPGPYLKERKKTFNGKWQAPSNAPSRWTTENHAHSTDLIFIGKPRGWQRGSLNFCVFAFSPQLSLICESDITYIKNRVSFTYLYLCTHVSILYVIILYLWHQLLRKIDLECPVLVDFLSKRQRWGEREQVSERARSDTWAASFMTPWEQKYSFRYLNCKACLLPL